MWSKKVTRVTGIAVKIGLQDVGSNRIDRYHHHISTVDGVTVRRYGCPRSLGALCSEHYHFAAIKLTPSDAKRAATLTTTENTSAVVQPTANAENGIGIGPISSPRPAV